MTYLLNTPAGHAVLALVLCAVPAALAILI